jgi:hypothetical protein
MTRVISKKLRIIACSVFAATLFSSPNLLLAQGRSRAAVPARENAFCQRLTNAREQFENRFGNSLARLEDKLDQRSDSLGSRRTQRDAGLGEVRSRRDTNRERHFAAIEGQAQSEEKKNALAHFQLAINTAVEERRSAFDEALQDFRESMDELLVKREDLVEDAKNAYLSSARRAYSIAQSKCAEGGDDSSARQDLLDNLKSAREKYLSDLHEIVDLKNELDSLISARRSAIELAMQAFHESVEEAKAQLQAALE